MYSLLRSCGGYWELVAKFDTLLNAQKAAKDIKYHMIESSSVGGSTIVSVNAEEAANFGCWELVAKFDTLEKAQKAAQDLDSFLIEKSAIKRSMAVSEIQAQVEAKV
jgi:hypothetical protein